MCVKSQLQIVGQDLAELSLIDVVCKSATILWREWPQYMEIAGWMGEAFTLRGNCPHCRHDAAFITVTQPFREDAPTERMIAASRCIACNGYILAILKAIQVNRNTTQFVYDAHFPVGEPDDNLPMEIPPEIATDFREAIRAQWIKAFKATVLMCRRSLQGQLR